MKTVASGQWLVVIPSEDFSPSRGICGKKRNHGFTRMNTDQNLSSFSIKI